MADTSAPATLGGSTGRVRASHAGRRSVVVMVGGVVVVQAVLAVLFGWPAARSTPHDLPIAVVGQSTVVNPMVGGLTAAHPGAFAIRQLGDAAAAQAAITDRQVYGAIVADRTGVSVLTASAASPAVAQLLAQGIPQAIRARAPGVPVRVQDLAPNPAGDPHGAVPATILIPVVITSLVGGALLAFLAGSALSRLAGLVGLALVGGAMTTLVVQSWLGALAGSYLNNSAVLSLIILAIAATTAGLARLLHAGGIALAALTIFFFGFPFSGATSAPELLPQPWGSLGQALPAGAGSTALRLVSFFDGAGAGQPLLVLGLWAVVGLALLLLPSHSRSQRPQSAG